VKKLDSALLQKIADLLYKILYEGAYDMSNEKYSQLISVLDMIYDLYLQSCYELAA
jgi:hypothetical protein